VSVDKHSKTLKHDVHVNCFDQISNVLVRHLCEAHDCWFSLNLK